MVTEILDRKPENPSSVDSDHKTIALSGRAEIDTSSPFKSVKEAANLFGGMGFWKPFSQNPSEHVSQVEENTAKLEHDIRTTKSETIDIQKELETTKNTVQQLKLTLHKENSSSLDLSPSEAPGLILLELKQAKLNLTRSTNNISEVRSAIDFFNTEIGKQRMSLEETRQRLLSNTSKITCLEEELNKTMQELDLVKDIEIKRSNIEETKTKTITAEKTKQAARASEALALEEIKALQTESDLIIDQEYESFISKTRGANVTQIWKRVEEATEHLETQKRDLEEALSRVEVANRGKLAIEQELEQVKSVMDKLSERKKLGFARFSFLFTKHSNMRKKKKKTKEQTAV